MKLTYLLAAIFLLIVTDTILDTFENFSRNKLLFDLIMEGIILLTVAGTVYFVWKKLIYEKTTNYILEEDLVKTIKQSHVWEKKSKDFVAEFQHYIIQQLTEWKLSRSEKEIASVRFTSERTVRNQCRTIYKKSGCSGKNSLSSFFLNQLLTTPNSSK